MPYFIIYIQFISKFLLNFRSSFYYPLQCLISCVLLARLPRLYDIDAR